MKDDAGDDDVNCDQLHLAPAVFFHKKLQEYSELNLKDPNKSKWHLFLLLMLNVQRFNYKLNYILHF